MTSLAWDGKVLATDSKASQGQDIAMINDVSKIHLPGPDDYWEIMGNRILAFALAGNASDRYWAIEALNQGVTHKTRIEEALVLDFLTIAIDEMGIAWYWGMSKNDRRPDGLTIINPVSGPCSGGTGQVIAQAVMSTGAGAVKAIEQAIRLDNHSGGSIQTWEFPGQPEVPSKRPEKPEGIKDKLSPEEMTTLIKETAYEVHMKLLKQREDAKAAKLVEQPAANDQAPATPPVEPPAVSEADRGVEKIPA